MKCGEFRKRAKNKITIQAKSLVSDSIGGQVNTWTTQSQVYGIIKSSNGREVYEQEQRQSRTTHKIIIRYQSALKSTKDTGGNRVSFDSRLFDIKAITNHDRFMEDEGKAFQTLYCVENGAEI